MPGRPAPTTAPVLGEPLPVELMNTVWADQQGGRDSLSTRAELQAWLAAVAGRRELTDLTFAKPPTTDQLALFRELRDALRTIAAEVTADTRVDTARTDGELKRALRTLNRASAAAPSWPQLSWRAGEQPHLVTKSSGAVVETVLCRIAHAAARLFGGDGREALRACYAPGCVLYFVREHPRREWCSAACGNRARVARHYQRHRAGRSSQTSLAGSEGLVQRQRINRSGT
jgi:predicted RNA-binding Zn ribbon-like protein